MKSQLGHQRSVVLLRIAQRQFEYWSAFHRFAPDDEPYTLHYWNLFSGMYDWQVTGRQVMISDADDFVRITGRDRARKIIKRAMNRGFINESRLESNRLKKTVTLSREIFDHVAGTIDLCFAQLDDHFVNELGYKRSNDLNHPDGKPVATPPFPGGRPDHGADRKNEKGR
ncbi:MAG TPA: hypothetical protein VE397_14170 [Stellaceae bacterium]|jgi:hypothetical protein|nr:hypothetical protein [Stellaceae bacterium]